jgi:hypothetical protein
MIYVLITVTQTATRAAFPVPFHQIDGHLQFVVKNLPEENFDLKRNLASPNKARYSVAKAPISQKPI